ncbi:MAG: fibronectin type III domain-containing protein, partial [Limisphaerales bacterium]
MKTEICPPPSALAGRLRLLGAVILAASSAAAGFAQTHVATIGGGVSTSHYGYVNGETARALFKSPMGLAMDSSGDLFIADYGNNAIREITGPGSTDGGVTATYATNHISSPVGVVIDGNNNAFVLNRGGTTAVCTNGSVVEYDKFGILVATNATHLTNAAAIALDTSGNIYVTERSNLVIEISGGVQTTIATVTAPNALLKGIAVLPGGNLAVCDFGRDGIYTITPGTGIWTTNAGFNGQGDGTGFNNIGMPNSMARFFQPFGIAAAGDGTVIVSDFGNDRVKVVTASGVTTNLYGVATNDWISADPPDQFPGWVDGNVGVPDAPGGVAARCPAGILLSSDGTALYTTEDYYHLIRQVAGVSFAQFVSAPGAPTGLSAVLATNGQGALEIILTWTAPATGNATNYLVESAPSAGGPFATLGQTPGTTYTVTSPAAGEPYYFVVQAANGGGLSGQSSVVSITTPTLPPPAPVIGWF